MKLTDSNVARLISLTILVTLPSISIASSDELEVNAIEKIVVNGNRNQPSTEITEPTQKLLNVAGVTNDPLNSVYSMPGVLYAGGDEGGQPAIRGSSPEDNAFYIDGMPVDYIFHLFGDSIFNENVVSDFALHQAAFGSEFGDATGGIFDIKLRDPRNQQMKSTLDVSLLKLGMFIESGITENQAAYFSYRRSLIQLFLPEGYEEDGYTVFQAPSSEDYQGKYQWLIGNDDTLTFTISGASDSGGINISRTSEMGRIDPDLIGDFKLETQFDSQSIAWQHYGNGQKVFHVSVGHTSSESRESLGQGQYIDIKDDRLNARFRYQFNWIEQHKLIMGADIKSYETVYRFDAIPYYCTDHDTDCLGRKGARIQDQDKLEETNLAGFISDIWTLNEEVELDLGFRYEKSDYTNESFLHPRASITWYASDELNFEFSTGSYSRFPELETVLPKIGNINLNSPTAEHYNLKGQYQFTDLWKGSVDVYVKNLKDLPRSLDQDDVNYANHYDSEISGKSYGVEVLVEREEQDGWYGWASLSYAKSERTDEVDQVTSDYYLDTPLLLNAVGNYKLNDQWSFGFRATIRSGARYTPIIGLKDNPEHDGYFLAEYGALNSQSLPTYVRLDIQADYETTLFGYEAKYTFALLNATGNDNISGYYYAPSDNDSYTNFDIKGEKGLGTFPSIGVKIDF